MNTLKTSLSAAIKQQFGGQLAAAVIDDEVDSRDIVPPETWIGVRAQLMDECDTLWAKIDDLVEDYRDSSGDAELSLADWSVIQEHFAQENILTKQERDALHRADRTLRIGLSPLLLLAQHLSGCGVEIEYYDSLPSDEELVRQDIIFLDYQFDYDDSQGGVAKQVLKAIMRVGAVPERDCPALTILMSKNLRQEQAAVWEDLSTRGGYLRFNYTFLDKNVLQTVPDALLVRVLDLIKRKPVSACYYREIRCIQDAVTRAAQETANTLFGVSPTEMGRFAPIMEKEGASVADALLALYSELLQRQIGVDAQVKNSFLSLDESVRDLPEHLGVLPSRRFLHDLMASCVFDPAVCADSPVRFGDVYRPNPDRQQYEMVITQECDLSNRSDGVSTASSVLLLTGEVVTAIPKKSKTNLVYQPFHDSQASSPCWIQWDLCGLKVRQLRGLAVNLLNKRVFRMRFAEADRLQQEVATRLTRVATDRFPHATQILPCGMNVGDRELVGGLDLSVVHGKYGDAAPKGSITELAFGPCIDALLNNTHALGLSLNEALNLRQFRTRNDFKQKLASSGLRLLKDRDGIYLSSGNGDSLPAGSEEWLK